MFAIKTKTITKNGKEEERTIPVAKGDPIKDYYPKVIDEGLFYKVQELRVFIKLGFY